MAAAIRIGGRDGRPAALSLALHCGVLAAALALSSPFVPPAQEPPPLVVEVVKDGMETGTGGGGGGPAPVPSAENTTATPPIPAPTSQPVPTTRTKPRPPSVKPKPAAAPNPQGAVPAMAPGDGERPGPETAGDGPADLGRGGARSGTGAGAGGDEMESYLGRLRRTIQDNLIYPPTARRLGLTGQVKVHFLIRPDGTVDLSSLRTNGGTDDDILQRSALDTIRRVAAFPPPPIGAVGIQVPVSFTLTPR